MRQSKPITYHIGNALMAFSLLLLLFIYYPIIEVYLFPKPLPKNIHQYEFAIEIPKIHVYSPIIPNVDPFNSVQYHEALTHGIALAKNSYMPGQGSTTYLFAHSSDVPWRITRYNTIFYKLGELQHGDTILIVNKSKEFQYRVTDKKTVWPWEISYILDTKKNQLILQTCVPIGTAFQRLLVFAKPV